MGHRSESKTAAEAETSCDGMVGPQRNQLKDCSDFPESPAGIVCEFSMSSHHRNRGDRCQTAEGSKRSFDESVESFSKCPGCD